MAVVRYQLPMNLAGRFQLEIKHFVRGTYPEANDDIFAELPFNRLLIPLCRGKDPRCVIRDHKQKFSPAPGNVYFIPMDYKANVRLDHVLEFISIQFTLELYEGLDIFSRYSEIHEIREPEFSNRAVEAYQEKNPFHAAAKLHALVFDLAIWIMNSMSGEDWEAVTKFADFQKELDYVHANRSRMAEITVEELSSLRGLSRETFSRNFSHATGIPPKQFLTKLLINQACRLLIQEESSVKEISAKLGFENEFYFSRFFRKHMNLPPRQYRVNWKTIHN